MVVATAEVHLYAPWVHSLKEKRMLVKSLCARTRNRFPVSIAEVAQQDVHQTAVLGIACVSGQAVQAQAVVDGVLRFLDSASEAELVSVARELL